MTGSFVSGAALPWANHRLATFESKVMTGVRMFAYVARPLSIKTDQTTPKVLIQPFKGTIKNIR